MKSAGSVPPGSCKWINEYNSSYSDKPDYGIFERILFPLNLNKADKRYIFVLGENRKLTYSIKRSNMKNKSHYTSIIIYLSVFFIFACSGNISKKDFPKKHTQFDSNTLIVNDDNNTKKVRGQVLYLPIYSNVPYFEYGFSFDLSAFVAIHNTDFNNRMKITKVLFFDNEGKLVSNYLDKDTFLQPLGAVNFFVPENDQSGTGANFIVEWVSDTLINEPLIESVMIGTSKGQGISFSSIGRIVRETR